MVRTSGFAEECSAHGLRKAGLVRLAEAGCTEVELRAISGHKSLAELKPYIEKVEQQRAGASAMAKLQAVRDDVNNTRTSPSGRGANPSGDRTPGANGTKAKVSRRLKSVSPG